MSRLFCTAMTCLTLVAAALALRDDERADGWAALLGSEARAADDVPAALPVTDGALPLLSQTGNPWLQSLPGAPTMPTSAQRPEGWPGGTVSEVIPVAAQMPAPIGVGPVGQQAMPVPAAPTTWGRMTSPGVEPPPWESGASAGYPAPVQPAGAAVPFGPVPAAGAPAGYVAPQAAAVVPAAARSMMAAPPPAAYPPPGPGWPAATGAQQTDYPFRPRVFEIDGATIIARIDGEVVLAGEISGGVNEVLAQNADKIPLEQVEQIRQQLMRQRLKPLIDFKLAGMEARRKIPADNLPKIEEQIGKEFDKSILPKMMAQSQVATRAQLEAKLTALGTSVSRERKAFVDQTLARQWIHTQVKENIQVSRDELWKYYQEHLADFEFQAAAKWEELNVRFDRHATGAEAWSKLAAMGNQVLAGASFPDIARAQSEGPTAALGGQHDWTTQGSLRSEAIDRALFSLPVGQMSPIFEDTRGYTIVRVTERRDAGREPFADCQDTIKQKILEERRKGQVEAYVASLRRKARVWTIFDGHVPAEEVGQQSSSSGSDAPRVVR